MFLYLAGLSKTTPVSSSIFTSLQPIWVFLIMIFFYKEKAGAKKIIGISIGLIGALVCILTQQSDDLASDAFTGNMLCLLSSVVYAVYLILSQRILTAIGAITMLRIYLFRLLPLSAIIVTFITGFDAPVFSMPFHWTPFLILMFVLIFRDHYQLYAAACRFEISEDDGSRYLWLFDSDCGDHCFPCSRTRSF